MSNEKIMYDYVFSEFLKNIEKQKVEDFISYAVKNKIITYKTMRDYLIRYEFIELYKTLGRTRTSILVDLSIKYDLALTRVRDIVCEKKRKKRQ